jgi:hypothetical protein
MSDFYIAQQGADLGKVKLWDLIPKSYRLDSAPDALEFVNDSDCGFWVQKRFIKKPLNNIRLVYDVKDYRENLIKIKKFGIRYPTIKIIIEKDPLKDNTLANLQSSTTKEIVPEKNFSNLTPKPEDPNKAKGKKSNNYYDNFLLQKYIEFPFTMNGHLTDLRAYVVVLSANPVII